MNVTPTENASTKKTIAVIAFIVTPPILDVDAFLSQAGRLADTGLPVVAGVPALESVRHAEFLVSEIVGVKVSDAVWTRLRTAADQADAAMQVTLETIARLKDHVQGIQLTSFHGSALTTERVLVNVGRSPRG